MLISIIALIIAVLGWVATYWFSLRATNIGRIRDFQLKIYQELLDRTNTLIKDISSYTAKTVSHTNSMAKLLNEYVSDELSIVNLKTIDRKYELKRAWLNAAYELSEQSYNVQGVIEDYLRYLDMNGTDYTSGTKLFDALQGLKQEAYTAAESNRKRWSDPSEMDNITIEQYKKKSIDTKKDADIVFDFGMCVEDVLLHMYNSSIAEYIGKPKKKLNMDDKRRYVTAEGVIDKRTKSGKVM